jgi:hypothetical protein
MTLDESITTMQETLPFVRREKGDHPCENEMVAIGPSLVSWSHRQELHEQKRGNHYEENHDDDVTAQVEAFEGTEHYASQHRENSRQNGWCVCYFRSGKNRRKNEEYQ